MTANKTLYFKKAVTIFIMVTAFFIFSCQKRPILKKPPEKKVVIDHFSKAEGYWHQKRYDKALAAYDEYLKVYPSGARVRDALTRKATIYYNRNQYEDALPLFLDLFDEYPLEERTEIHLLTAKTYFHLKRYPESRLSALRWLELYKYYPGKEEIFLLLGQNLKELNEYPKALFWWLKLLESASIKGEQKEKIRAQILDLIYRSEEAELKEMADYAKESDLIFPIYYQLTLSLFKSDKLEEARQAATMVARLAPEEEWVTKAKEVLKKIGERLRVSPNIVGCLLPLSGPFAIYGQEVLNGLELGLDIFQEGNEDLSTIELVIRDTGGDPEIAIEAIKELAEEERAIVTIGPLISKVAEGVVEKAQEFGIPIITLSQSEGITEKGEMVFQNCLTPEDQIRSLINKVIGEMGLKRFAILYPANGYGRYFMNKLWDKVESQGGEITAVESYNPKDTDFATEIKKLVGLFYPRPELELDTEEEGEEQSEQRVEELEREEEEWEELEREEEEQEEEELEEELEEEPEPIIDFDAIFIPDSHERITLIAPQLVYYDVVDITLLGTNLWYSPKLIETAGRYVRGAIFPSGFFSGSGYEGVDIFVDQYKTNFGQEPGLLSAIGYDTIRIVKEIIKQRGEHIKTREDLRSALAEDRYFDSVTGPMVFDNKRMAKRNPLLLTIRGRHFLPMP